MTFWFFALVIINVMCFSCVYLCDFIFLLIEFLCREYEDN